MGIIRKIKEKYPWLVYVAALIPFFVACYGYYKVGTYSFWEMVYAAIAIYFVNPVSEDVNAYILFGEITSVIVVASVILSILRYAYAKIAHFFVRLHKDSTVVYTDTEIGRDLAATLKHGYFTDNEDKLEKVNNYIIMFEDDSRNVAFYSKNESKLESKNLYLMMTELDSTLIKAADPSDTNLHFFNINELIARDYWKKHNLYDAKDKHFKIVIVGDNDIARAIFKYGYLNNLYTMDQKFEYHLFGPTGIEASFIASLPTENKDAIFVHDEDIFNSSEILKEADRIIYCYEENTIKLTQAVLYNNPSAQIHCFSQKEISYEDVYDSDKIIAFGNLDGILTEENIKREKLYRQGKLYNYDYCLRSMGAPAPADYEAQMEKEWRKLNGFKKSSSIARADHYWIEKRLKDDGILNDEDEDALKIEHIRWSRFHFINHWSYAEKRDNERRKHNLLVPYEKLAQSEKEKDGIYDPTIQEEINKLI